jgi:hypothetical protein
VSPTVAVSSRRPPGRWRIRLLERIRIAGYKWGIWLVFQCFLVS